MKPAALLAFLTLTLLHTAAPALAKSASPNERAAAQARKYLIPCTRYSGYLANMCQQNRADFVDEYVRARSGAAEWMDQMADYFGTFPANPAKVRYPGIISDQVLGCAWLKARTDLHPDDNISFKLKTECSNLGPAHIDRVLAHAADIVHQIQIAPTNPPPVPPIEHPECLDSRACLLDGNCPPFVPPPGCPGR